MGVPVIASDLPALQEMIVPGERGLTFNAGDPGSLAEVVAQLIDDPGLSGRLTGAARAWVETERSVGSNAERYASVISNVLR